MHRKIVEPALSALKTDRAEYFNRLVDGIERDVRTAAMPNLIYLVLKETIPYLPMHLSEEALQERLFEFVRHNQTRLNRIIHDRRFLESPKRLSEITKELVLQVLSSSLEDHQLGKIRDLRAKEEKAYRFSYPGGNQSDFPYQDDDD